jgi:hypothetical protein
MQHDCCAVQPRRSCGARLDTLWHLSPMQAVQTATTSAQHANAVAQDVAASRSAKEARTKLCVVLRQIDSSAWFAKIARAMVRIKTSCQHKSLLSPS